MKDKVRSGAASVSSNASNREWFERLSEPKKDHLIWEASNQHPGRFGTQEVITLLPENTLNAKPSSRVLELAKPKTDWRMKKHENETSSAMNENKSSSGRLEELAMPKKANIGFIPARTLNAPDGSATYYIWTPKRRSRTKSVSPRLEQLSQSKSQHPDFLPHRSVEKEILAVPKTALRANSSSRLESLAEARRKMSWNERDPYWPISKASLETEASERTKELSVAKKVSEDFQPARYVITKVHPVTKRYQATPRITELSAPILRQTSDSLMFRANAFNVSEYALKGTFPPRVLELAEPIRR